MKNYLFPVFFLLASFQAAANITPTLSEKEFEFHWTLPTTLDGIRQECANLKISEDPIPASIMCREQHSGVQGVQEVQGVQVDVDNSERYWTVKRDLSLASVPYIVLGISAHAIKRDVRKINNDINSGFHNRADDYIQYAPLVLTWA